MGKLFDFDIHIGDWRVLVQSRDIQNGAVQSRHITDNAIVSDKIGDGEVKSRNIDNDAVTSDKIGDGEVKTKNIGKEAVTNEKIADGAVTGDEIRGGTVQNGKIADDAVQTRNIKNRNVTLPKLGEDVMLEFDKIKSLQNQIFNTGSNVDQKYKNITDELYSMIASLQVGGIALSQKLGERTDIGISQNGITEAITRIWSKLEDMTGECYIGFNMFVTPNYIAVEGPATVNVTADSTGGISNFDLIRVYANGELKAENMAVETLTTSFEITEDTVVTCVATIAGRTYTKEETIHKYTPFFIGSGQDYTDVMTEECIQTLEGTLEGNYDMTVQHDGDYIFIIIPPSTKPEFRRADINGYEIPLSETETEELVIYKSLNTYTSGEYNIDIDINT